ncbi:hypothetical protein K469DRAFT_650684 [Zopfia rhizophila CBS 207.26]|uniref:Uncharacterized protein n=1 Tax=Zopfia rhizophila CBS 207.26 TaxID=1314779 RepID=A0A6A6EVE7_9PEZI|nr:hypothetical protein K469DRAFT_650684 [Zopfia rhizophila CBS 207.26]
MDDMTSQPDHVLTEPLRTSSPNSILADCSQKNIARPDSIETISASNQSIIEATIKIFAQQLKAEWKRLRAPQGLKKKFLEARTTKATATARIFLDHGGFKAWVAYFLATEGKAHFKGRHDRTVTLARFQILSLNARINAARGVARIQPHSTVNIAIHKIEKTLESGGFLVAPPKCNEEARQNFPASSAISTGCENTPFPNKTQSDPIAIPEISPNAANQQHLVLEKASLQGTADVFDEYMCGAIRRDTVQSGGITYLKAAVTMDFPFQGLVDCLMSLDIHQSKVEYLAMALFNVHVESVGQVRYIVLKDGVRLMPNPEITLKGALGKAIIDVFGPEIHGAIVASRIHKRELEEGNRATECVSMILTSSSEEGAIINLSMGLEGGAQIQNKLYT